jgi:hypothetical protein
MARTLANLVASFLLGIVLCWWQGWAVTRATVAAPAVVEWKQAHMTLCRIYERED